MCSVSAIPTDQFQRLTACEAPMGSERDNCSTRPASPSTTISSRSHTPVSLAESTDSISSRISAPVVLPSRCHPPMAPMYSVKARSSPSLRQPVERRMFRSQSTPPQPSTLGLDSSPESSQYERTERPRRRKKQVSEPTEEQRRIAEEHFARRVAQSLDYGYRKAFLSQKDQLQSYLQSSSLTSMERAVCLRKIGELYISTACLSDDGTGRKMAEIAMSYFKHAVEKSEHRDPESCYLLGRTVSAVLLLRCLGAKKALCTDSSSTLLPNLIPATRSSSNTQVSSFVSQVICLLTSFAIYSCTMV